MSDPIATYSFLPWLRQGLANHIQPGGENTAGKLRANIPVRLSVSATKTDGSAAAVDPVDKNIEIYGPGDIVGIDSRAIVKTEPRNWITNFEPNYLPYIDFYEEDFPWRYTPAAPDSDRLTPWIMLVVLKEDEFDDGTNSKGKPLPFFKLKEGKKTAEIFPPVTQLWAWAHVHVNQDLSNGAVAVPESVNAEINQLIAGNPDNACSRIISPRKLETNTGYHAFLVPTFESGRLAGLDIAPPETLTAAKCAWENPASIEFPYYHRWYFRTGNVGDFEYLVNLLKPKPADKSVGVRDIDILHPGSNLLKADVAEDIKTRLTGILKLGGALRVPFDSLKEVDKEEVIKYDNWDENPYPHALSKALAQRINLADDYVDASKTIQQANKAAEVLLGDGQTDPDPVITSPLYGRWHAMQQRLLTNQGGGDLANNRNWVHELNLDPRFRVAAGLGTKVVQKGQEEYMQAAWEQVGQVIEANNRIRMAQLAQQVSIRMYQKHITPLIAGKALTFTAPVQRRLLFQNLTVHRQVKNSLIPNALLSGTFRRIVRARGTVMKKFALENAANTSNLVALVNAGRLVVAPPKGDPSGAINLSDVTRVSPGRVPGLNAATLNFIRQSGILTKAAQDPGAVARFRKSAEFVISEPRRTRLTLRENERDSKEASVFKAALKDAFKFVRISNRVPEKTPLILDEMTEEVKKMLDPAITIPKRTFDSVKIPARIGERMVETFAPVMVYPEIDLPMYKPLADMSAELFLPNINLIEQNSITLLENNQKFIEAYMVGIDHEMSRELLWREYPTDQRGTYFRQFWDVTSFLPQQPVPEDIKETLYDIPPIHKWSKIDTAKVDPANPDSPRKNELGTHNQRALASGKTQLVLVIRGELLKKYPTAVVYAHKADWGKKNGVPDVTVERVLTELTEAQKSNPPETLIKTPLFEAKVEPDIYFFGFDLDDEEARGTLNPVTTGDNSGWFFVIKERPGEPRFGLDIEKTKTENGDVRLINWNNFSWEHTGTQDGKCIELNSTASFTTANFNVPDPDIDQENVKQLDDIQAGWTPDSNAAELAYILYQVPVLVGVHASRMLPK
jgi:hypothetical protein